MIDLSLLRGVWVDPARPHRARPGRLHARRRRPRDAAARPGRRARLRLRHRHRRPHRRRRLRLPHAPPRLDLRHRGVDGSRHRRRRRSCARRQTRTPTCSGPCAAAAATSASSLRSSTGSFPVGPEILGGAIAWRGEDAAGARSLPRVQRQGAARADQRGRAAHRAAGAVAAEGGARQADRRHLRLPQRHVAEDGEALARALAHARASRWPTSLTRRPYTQMQSLLDATQPKGRRYYWKSHYLPRIDARLIDTRDRRMRAASSRRTRRSCCSRSAVR